MNPWHFDVFAGAGSLVSSANDMLKYIKFNIKPPSQFEKAVSQCHKIWKPETNEKVGLGWHRNYIGYDEIIWHNGGTYGYTSYLG